MNQDNPGNKVVFGLYDSRPAVEGAVEMLKNSGFRSSDISVLMPTTDGIQAFAHDKATKAPEGAAAGAATGAVGGGGLGWLVGIGSLAVPGLGPLIAAGPFISTLAGVGIGGAIGNLTGCLIGMGLPEHEAKRYEGFVKSGGTFLSVHADDREWMKKAREILETSGAKDIASTTEKSTDSKDQAKLVSEKRNDDVNPANLL